MTGETIVKVNQVILTMNILNSFDHSFINTYVFLLHIRLSVYVYFQLHAYPDLWTASIPCNLNLLFYKAYIISQPFLPLNWWWDMSVGTAAATSWIGVRFPAEQNSSLLHSIQTSCRACSVSYIRGTRDSFPGGNHSPPPNAQVKNGGTTSVLPHTSSWHGAQLIKPWHNFIFTFHWIWSQINSPPLPHLDTKLFENSNLWKMP
jgi:hypothetical protein